MGVEFAQPFALGVEVGMAEGLASVFGDPFAVSVVVVACKEGVGLAGGSGVDGC